MSSRRYEVMLFAALSEYDFFSRNGQIEMPATLLRRAAQSRLRAALNRSRRRASGRRPECSRVFSHSRASTASFFRRLGPIVQHRSACRARQWTHVQRAPVARRQFQ